MRNNIAKKIPRTSTRDWTKLTNPEPYYLLHKSRSSRELPLIIVVSFTASSIVVIPVLCSLKSVPLLVYQISYVLLFEDNLIVVVIVLRICWKAKVIQNIIQTNKFIFFYFFQTISVMVLTYITPNRNGYHFLYTSYNKHTHSW